MKQLFTNSKVEKAMESADYDKTVEYTEVHVESWYKGFAVGTLSATGGIALGVLVGKAILKKMNKEV